MAWTCDTSRGDAFDRHFSIPANNRYDNGRDRGRDHIRRSNVPADHIGPGMVWNSHHEDARMVFGQRGPRGQTQWPGDSGVLGTNASPPRRNSHWQLNSESIKAVAQTTTDTARAAEPRATADAATCPLPSSTPEEPHDELVELCEDLDAMNHDLRQLVSKHNDEPGRDAIRRDSIAPMDHIGPGMVWNPHHEESVMGFGQRGPRGQTQWPKDSGVLGSPLQPARRPSHWELDKEALARAAAMSSRRQ